MSVSHRMHRVFSVLPGILLIRKLFTALQFGPEDCVEEAWRIVDRVLKVNTRVTNMSPVLRRPEAGRTQP